LRYSGSPFSFSVSKEKITSSGVIGVPSDQRAFARNVNSAQDLSAGTATDSAISPYSEFGSSLLCTMRLSVVRFWPRIVRPVAGVPLTM
jgi:hypothetical protein